MKIGIPQVNYHTDKRMGFPIESIEWEERRVLPLYNGISKRILPWKWSRVLRAASYFPGAAEVDGLHVFNSIVLNKGIPWIVSAERHLPTGVNPAWAMRSANWFFSRLAGGSCKAILNTSHNGREALLSRYQNHPSAGEVASKTQVVYPCVPATANPASVLQKDFEGTLKFLFIGRDFFHKGGNFVVDAFASLSDRQARLTVVTDFCNWSGDRRTLHGAPRGSTDQWKRKMSELGVQVFGSMPYNDVRKLIREHHALLFPSLEETFGFIIPEAMAEGTVPAALSIRAVPEIIQNSRNGYLINVPVDSEGALDRRTVTADELVSKLRAVMQSMLRNRRDLKQLSLRALAAWRAKFSPDHAGSQLLRIYQDAFSAD